MTQRTVGTTVRYHCLCVMENGEELFIKMKATSEAEASQLVHSNYIKVKYVLEILTSEERDRRTRHLRPGIGAGVARLDTRDKPGTSKSTRKAKVTQQAV